MRILLIAASLALASCSANQAFPPGVPVPTELEARQALRDALSLAAVRAIQRASQVDGYYADQRIRIDIAPDPEIVKERLRQAGFGAQLERSVLQLNRVAEQASLRAKPAFIKAITELDIDQPLELLAGAEDAGTRELIEQAYDDIHALYLPVLSAVMDQSDARVSYRKIIDRYNELSLGDDVDPELDDFLTREAIDGLLVLMAEEEAHIRRTPSARGTREIDRVFRVLD